MFKPHKYQLEGVEFLTTGSHQKLLADEMGLGKTPQLIWAAQKIKAHSILVVCPSIAKYNWQKEFSKFAGNHADVLETGQSIKYAVNICSFEYAKKHVHVLKKIGFDLLIVDEAHYLKEPTSGRAKGILGTRGLIHHATRSWFATGTPAPNNASEIWVFLYTFGLTKLSYDGFTARYCNSHRTSGKYSRIQITGSNTRHTPELKALLKQCSLRRLKKDVLDLPPISHNTYLIKGDDDSSLLRLFPDLKDKIENEFAELKEKLNFEYDISEEKLLGALSLMSPSIMSLRRYHGLKKVVPVAELIRSELLAKEYKKIFLFGIHTDVLKYLKLSIGSEFKPLLITGETPPIERQRIIDRFQEDDSVQVLIGNIQAAGTAITATAANQVGFIEQDWVPGNNAQAADRVHRFGQKLPVTVRHFAIANSIDEKITATLTRKTKEISTFIS